MRRKAIIYETGGYWLCLAKQACQLRYYYYDMVWLPRYYSLCITPFMDFWTAAERRKCMDHPLYRDIPILEYHKQDVEIAAVLAAWVNFGKKKFMPQKCVDVRKILTEHPYNSLMWQDYRYWRYNILDICFSRYIYQDLIDLYDRLWRIYKKYGDLEAAVSFAMRVRKVDHVQAFLLLFEGIKGFQPCKDTLYRVNMLFRWLVLGYKVDLGIWKCVDPKDLHVCVRASDIKYLPKLPPFKNLKLDSKDLQEVVDRTSRDYFPRCPSIMDYLIRFHSFGGLLGKTKIPHNVVRRSYSTFISVLVGKNGNGVPYKPYRRIVSNSI